MVGIYDKSHLYSVQQKLQIAIQASIMQSMDFYEEIIYFIISCYFQSNFSLHVLIHPNASFCCCYFGPLGECKGLHIHKLSAQKKLKNIRRRGWVHVPDQFV
jgi:hypothetical protein